MQLKLALSLPDHETCTYFIRKRRRIKTYAELKFRIAMLSNLSYKRNLDPKLALQRDPSSERLEHPL